MGNRGACLRKPLLSLPRLEAVNSPASKRGQDKRGFCRSAAKYHNYDRLWHNYGIIMGIYGTSINKNVCPDPVWKLSTIYFHARPGRRTAGGLSCS